MKTKIKLYQLIIINISVASVLLLITVAGNKSLNVINENTPLTGQTYVILDAGHGGTDGGALSCTGTPESALNLEITLRLNDLMNLLGIQTKLIRKTDISVHTAGESIAAKKVSDLKNRVAIVNNTQNAILISIHQNYFTDSRYCGAQVFYGASEQSRNFGQLMQSALVQTLNPVSKRKAKKADGIYLLSNINKPGILVECGFLSHPQEEAQLKNEQYQKKLCAVIATQTNMFVNQINIA